MDSNLYHQSYSRALRLWHWLTFIITGLLLFTVFVNKTFLNWMHSAPVLRASLVQSGATISEEQSFRAAAALKDMVWAWHTKFGYVLIGLFVFRLIIEFFQPQQEKLSRRIQTAIGFLRRREDRKNAIHDLIVRLIYLVFYALLAIIVVTGYLLSRDRGASETERFHSVRQVHEACFNFLLLFILVHLVGVIRSERRKKENIVSAMIHGGN